MKTCTVNGKTLAVPLNIRRLSPQKGWQVVFAHELPSGKKSAFFPDSGRDPSVSLKEASDFADVHRRPVETALARESLHDPEASIWESTRTRKNGQRAQIYVCVGPVGAVRFAKRIYVGTDQTATPERFAKAHERAKQIRAEMIRAKTRQLQASV
jgi:hypothetical protein